VTTDWEQYNFYRILEVEPDAGADEMANAHRQLTSSLTPDSESEEQKKATALDLIVADAALDVLSDKQIRNEYDSRLGTAQKAASIKAKVESKRAGKAQEELSAEEDEKLQKATVKYETARDALADFYYERLFDRAKESRFETIPSEKLMEWLSAERAESIRKAEQKGRKTSFRIDWQGFANVQDTRKKRTGEIIGLIDELVEKLQIT
jgi:DnaJ-class molecular chaperone